MADLRVLAQVPLPAGRATLDRYQRPSTQARPDRDHRAARRRRRPSRASRMIARFEPLDAPTPRARTPSSRRSADTVAAGRGAGRRRGSSHARHASARRCGRPPTSASSRAARRSARAARARRRGRARPRPAARRAGRTAAGSSRPGPGRAGAATRSSSRGSSCGTSPTARSNSRTKTRNAASQSRSAASSRSSGLAASGGGRLALLRLEDRDDRVALADLALGDDPPEPLPVVADREVGGRRPDRADRRAAAPGRARRSPTPRPRRGPGWRRGGDRPERLADLALGQRFLAGHEVGLDAGDRRRDAPGRAHLAPRLGELEADRLGGGAEGRCPSVAWPRLHHRPKLAP